MIAAIVAVLYLLINLFIALGAFTNFTLVACAAINVAGFALVLLLGIVPIPSGWGLHR